MSKATNRTLWTIQCLLALLYLFTGSLKLILHVAQLTQQIALPGALLRFIGAMEVLGAAGLILPGLLRVRVELTPLAASGLLLIMIGATVLTAAHPGSGQPLMPAIVGMLDGLVAWKRWGALPDTFEVKRMGRIQAPAERIFPLLADFHNWARWSPWEKLDPAMTKAYSGAASGRGAIYQWAGNSQAGAGRMEIVEAVAPSLVRIKLDFLKPFEAHNTAEFTLDARDGSTDVTWTMRGNRPYMLKVMSIFFSMDKMLGRSFEEGLANLKGNAENVEFSTKGA